MEAHRLRRFRDGRHPNLHPLRDRLAAIDHGPSFFPAHWGEEGLTAEVVIIAAIAPVCEEDRPPRAVGGLEKVGVAGALDIAVLRGQRTVCEDRVGGIGLVRAVDVAAAGYRKFMG